MIYHGSLKDTVAWERAGADEDEYFRRRHAVGIAYDTINHFRRVIVRVLNA